MFNKLNVFKTSSGSKYHNYNFVNVVFGEDYFGEDLLKYSNHINDYDTSNIGIHRNINGSSRNDIYIGPNNDYPGIKIVSSLGLSGIDKPDLEIKNQISDTNDMTPFFVSYNNDVMFGMNAEQKFSLVRIKVNFRAYYTVERNSKSYVGAINVPGEFIDVSVPYYIGDNKEKSFKWEDLKTYKFDTADKKEFDSYSVEQYFEDIYRILYNVHKYPWDDEKYDKRLKRLVLLGYIDMLSKVKNDLSFIKGKYNQFKSLTSMMNAIQNITKSIDYANKANLTDKFKQIREIFNNQSTAQTVQAQPVQPVQAQPVQAQPVVVPGSAPVSTIPTTTPNMILYNFLVNLVIFIESYSDQIDKLGEFAQKIVEMLNTLADITKQIDTYNKSDSSIINTEPTIRIQNGGSNKKNKYHLTKSVNLYNDMD